MTKIKICGITDIQDAEAAIALGADALGFNFYKRSPRYIEPAKAKTIVEALPPIVSLIGVFVDEFSPDRVMSMTHAVGMGTVQLHGSESAEYIKHLSELRVIKAFRVDATFDVNQLSRYAVNAFLLDAFEEGIHGGTGKTFNWDLAIEAKKHGRIILAGGLGPENIYEAIRKVEPYAVDVCSGVETEPGKKDFKKLDALFREIRRVQSDMSEDSAH
ncbi:MAG TPA: phosphoribosylanthranilate isomerase [Terriglobia bacterium]|nr:phosphoribosylanthranilate isomerase [Terriglobia bacterium]